MAEPAQTPVEQGLPAVRFYGDAAGYDTFMGVWSKALAPLFLRFAAPARLASMLDLGCGTGNLLAAAADRFPGARLVGIDPSTALLAQARSRLERKGVELIGGACEELPFADATFDGCLSLLVLQEFADRAGALREMRRVTRPGGIVAACQWDFPRMPVIAALVEALTAIGPGGQGRTLRSPIPFGDEAELAQAWIEAEHRDVVAARIEVTRRYRDFEDLWLSLLGGSTPSTLMLAGLPEDEREDVRRAMQSRFPAAARQTRIEIVAQALVVRGRA